MHQVGAPGRGTTQSSCLQVRAPSGHLVDAPPEKTPANQVRSGHQVGAPSRGASEYFGPARTSQKRFSATSACPGTSAGSCEDLEKSCDALAKPLRNPCGALVEPLQSLTEHVRSPAEPLRSPCETLRSSCEALAKASRSNAEPLRSPPMTLRSPLKPLQIGPLNCRGLVICCGLLNCCGPLTCSKQQNCCGLLNCRGQLNGREMPYNALIAHRWLAKIFPILLQKIQKHNSKISQNPKENVSAEGRMTINLSWLL